jgi:6-pyruvoyltetrahydropterin/6-carboxytetrahydropterin synthase
MFELQVEVDFSAAHRLCGYQGACSQLHGHNFRAVVYLRGSELDSQGMLIDFRDVKRICREVVGPLDHQFLNDVPPFGETAPTSENLARFLFGALRDALGAAGWAGRVTVSRVTVFESPECGVTYAEPAP